LGLLSHPAGQLSGEEVTSGGQAEQLLPAAGGDRVGVAQPVDRETTTASGACASPASGRSWTRLGVTAARTSPAPEHVLTSVLTHLH
jgi:hypothetical protein